MRPNSLPANKIILAAMLSEGRNFSPPAS